MKNATSGRSFVSEAPMRVVPRVARRTMTAVDLARQPIRHHARRLTLGRLAPAGTSALWFVVAARHLSVQEFGGLALLLSIGMMTAYVGDLGLSNLLTHVVAESPEAARSAVGSVI